MKDETVYTDEHGDGYILPEGAKIQWRPSGYACVIRWGCILMVHPYPYRYWMLPGGGIECGKELIPAGVVRECLEETGYTISIRPGTQPDVSENRFRATFNDSWYHAIIFIYPAELLSAHQKSECIGMHDDGVKEILDPQKDVRWISISTFDLNDCHPIHRTYVRAVRDRLG